MKKYRAALIGCGRIGHAFAAQRDKLGIYSHAEAYADCPRTDLVAVCDRDLDALDTCAEAWRVPGRFTDARQLLAEAGPEIVSICTPDHTHFALTMAALGIPTTRAVLLEKPLAATPAEAETLVAEAESRGVLLLVNYSRRYARSHIELRDAIHAGRFGNVQVVTGFYTKGVIHNGTHWFDLARFFFGDVVAVHGFPSRAPGADEATLDVRLEFASGLIGSVHGCDASAYSIFEMDILGRDGRVRLLDSGHHFETFTVADSPKYAGYRTLAKGSDWEGGLRDVTLHAVEDIVACLDSPANTPRCSGRDALAALHIAHAALASAGSGQRVAVAA